MASRPTTSDRTLVVHGGPPLHGTLRVHGAKNASLPIIIASLLTAEPVTLHNIPRVTDVDTLLEIMSSLGTRWTWTGPNSLDLHTPALTSITPPPALVLRMRASFELLGAILGRSGESKLTLPGGCALGPRPVDQHVKALRGMGASIHEDGGHVYAVHRRKLTGRVTFDLKTVGGTRNAIMAAVRGDDVTLDNASTEPEVLDLIRFLNTLGARIRVEGTSTIRIRGVEALSGGAYRIIPDRMEAGTFMLAAAATRGSLTLEGVDRTQLKTVALKLAETGVHIGQHGSGAITVDARGARLRPVALEAVEYPGFPTDLHPQAAAFLATLPGTSRIVDRVFGEHRFAYVPDLQRLGARIEQSGNTATITGGPLHGGELHATDLRVGGALLIAAMAAEGKSRITGVPHIERGYQDIQKRLASLGAQVAYS